MNPLPLDVYVRALLRPHHMKFRNLWWRPAQGAASQFFTYTGKCLCEHRGVRVFHNPAGSSDYVLGDAVIAQRGKFSKERAPELIDDILTGLQSADAVRAHLEKHGFVLAAFPE